MAVAGFPEFITIKEIADMCRISERTVRRMMKSGEIPPAAVHRFGWQIRVESDAIREWLRDGTKSRVLRAQPSDDDRKPILN